MKKHTQKSQKPLLDWFNQPLEQPKAALDPNPCVNLYGKGPEGKRCGACIHLFGICKSTTHYKCELRTNTHGAKTDHFVRWWACAKFEEREIAVPLYDGRT